MFYFLSFFYVLFLRIFLPQLNRSEGENLLTFLIVSFVLYLFILRYTHKVTLDRIFILGILLRVSCLFTIPVLSDDFYRFLWDGFLTSQGNSPFAYTPLDWMIKNGFSQTNLLEIYEKLNSKNYYSVYPMTLQLLFAIPWILGLDQLFHQVVCLQLVLFIFDICNLILVKKKSQDPHMYWIFVGNPLLILDSASQIHFEGMILFLLIIILIQLKERKFFISAIVFSILTQTKINFLFLTPGFAKNKTKREQIHLAWIILLSILFLFFTVFLNVSAQLESGVGLFFHSFRFNSLVEQIFYLLLFPFPTLRYLSGSLALMVGAMVYLWTLYWYDIPNEICLLLGMLFLLLFSPVLHSWYFIPFVGVSFYLGYHVSFSILLSIFALLSYLLYSFTSPTFAIALGLMELFIIGVYIWKIKPLSFLQKIPFSEG